MACLNLSYFHEHLRSIKDAYKMFVIMLMTKHGDQGKIRKFFNYSRTQLEAFFVNVYIFYAKFLRDHRK